MRMFSASIVVLCLASVGWCQTVEPPVAQVEISPPMAQVDSLPSVAQVVTDTPTVIGKLVAPPVDGWRDEYRPEFGGWVKVRNVPTAGVTTYQKPVSTSGVVESRPFEQTGTGFPSIQGIDVPDAGISLRKANPMERGQSTATTRIPPTTTIAPSANVGGSTKYVVAEWTDAQGNVWKRYSDGSTVICSAFG
jgi:hypothetical protein